MNTRYLSWAVLAALLVGLMLVPSPALAAAPANDDIGSALVIPALPYNLDKSILLDTTEATTAAGDPASCVFAVSHTVWYSFTPTANTTILADTEGSAYDTVLAVYTRSRRGVFTQVACNDDDQNLQSTVSFQAAAGTTYWFMVGSFGGSPGGNLVFSVAAAPPPPANDDIGSAAVIPSLPYNSDKSIALDTRGATAATDDADTCAGPVGASVWYSFTPTANTAIVADTEGSSYDTVLAVYTRTRRALTPVACNDEYYGRQSLAYFNAVAGTTYWFMVGSYNNGPGGSLVFSVTAQAANPPPANDDIGSATVIPSLPYNGDKTIALDTTGATTAASDPQVWGTFPTASVWYKFTATATTGVVADTDGSSYSTIMGVYTSNRRGVLTPVAENGSRVYFSAVAGTTYWMMVGAEGVPGSLLLSVAQAPVTIDLTINPTASLDPATGQVTVSGAVTCSAPVELYMGGYVEQPARGASIGGGLYWAGPISCNGVIPWSATAIAENGTFSAGKATAYVGAYSPVHGIGLDTSATVTLKAPRK